MTLHKHLGLKSFTEKEGPLSLTMTIFSHYSLLLHLGCVEFNTIYDFIPTIMGRKECRGTLFLASVMEACWVENSVGVHYSPCLLYIGRKECRGTLFPAHIRQTGGKKECRGTLFPAYVMEAVFSAGVHSFLPM